jgi:hypothetical protein
MISGNLEAKLIAGAYFGGIVLVALAVFALLPAGLIALINRSERRAVERVRREGARCQVFVKSYRRVSMTQHRVLFELYLPEGRVGREYMLSGLSDADLANWTALQIPLAAHANANAQTIALDAVPSAAASPSLFPVLLGATLAAALICGAAGAAMHSDDEDRLRPELRALCAALRSQKIDVANVQVLPRRPTGVIERALIDLDDKPYQMQLYAAVPTTEKTQKAQDCLRKNSVELCTSSDSRNGYTTSPMSPRVRTAFAAYAK